MTLPFFDFETYFFLSDFSLSLLSGLSSELEDPEDEIHFLPCFYFITFSQDDSLSELDSSEELTFLFFF